MTTRPPRVPFKRPLAVIVGGDRYEVEATNLSRGGLYVKSDGAPPRGTAVSLELGAAGRWLGFAEGEVVWCKRRGFAVRFTEIRPNAQALVEHLVARGGTGERRRRKRGPAALAALLLMMGAAALWHPRARTRPPEPPPPAMVAAPPAMSVAAITAQAYPGEFRFQLPTGAVSELRVTVDDHQVSVTPGLKRGAVIRNVFTLPHPARLVIDVNGRQPKYSWQLEGSTVVKSVRVGARNHGTRVVVDLPDGKAGRVVTPTS
jgi:PilZ domain/AMIN domain